MGVGFSEGHGFQPCRSGDQKWALAAEVRVLRMQPLRIATVLLIATSVFAQQETAKRPLLKVTISDVKPTYSVGDYPTFRVTLTNVGDAPIYIPKGFGEAGGGIPGFTHKVTFISGKPPEIGCGGNGDAMDDGKRTAEQIFRETYMILMPGEFVGREFEVQRCEFGTTGKHRAWGKFRIEISYWPWIQRWKEVAALPDLKFHVASEEVKAEPFEINIVESPEHSTK
jgi:hypothetical protein